MDFIQFIPEQLLILVAAIYVLGICLKNVEIIKDRYIPVILIILSIVLSVSMQGFSATSIVQGMLCWGAAIGINQTGKQIKKGDE